MTGIDINDVVTGLPGPAGGIDMPTAYIADVFQVHAAGLNRVAEISYRMVRRKWRDTAIEVGRVMAVVDQLATSQRSMGVHGLDHLFMDRHVVIVPHAALKIRRELGGMVYLNLFGTHHSPAAFGLHAAHGGHRLRVTVAHAAAVRYLVKTIASGDGAYLDGLEKYVVAGVAQMGISFLTIGQYVARDSQTGPAAYFMPHSAL